MANQVLQFKRFAGGIGSYLKEPDLEDAYYFGRCINYRDDPQAITLLPGAVKDSGSTVTDLLKWADIVPSTLTTYYYGNTGNIYSRSSAGSWSNLYANASSHGNGLAYFAGDDYLYFTGDSTFGRYGPISSSPQFTPDFLTSQGGVPTNTASLILLSASSQYATAADSASLSITGNLTLEAYFEATTLPTTGNSMTLIGKWDESGATRSYKMDLYGVSGYFGDGSDSALTISSDTTEAPIDSACTGTSGTTSLSATNVSFAAGQVIFIHQTQGTGAGGWQRNTIQGYTAGTITLGTALNMAYVSGAQVRVLKQYTNVTVNSGKTYTAKAWDGTVGGILGFLASGTVTVTGNISATGKGFRGGSAGFAPSATGEGTAGASSSSYTVNGNGAGGANSNESGAGGGNGTAGSNGTTLAPSNSPALGGSIAGSSDLTTMVFGGGGSGGENTSGGAGGNGGGIIFINAVTLTTAGTIISSGSTGSNGSGIYGGGGGGAGGSILLKAQTATLGTSLITASGGTGGTGSSSNNGGDGGVGRIHLDYLTSYTGTTTPTLNATQDNTLVTTTTIQGRLGISNDGTAFEYLTQNLTTLTTAAWYRLSIAWTASTSTASFYLNGTLVGTAVGTKTSISDNTSLLYIGANKTSVVANFFNGKVDDIRIWGAVRSASDIYAYNSTQLTGTEANLKAYYKLNSAATDATSNANNLTLVNTPSYSTSDVPFPAPTTRLDIDASYTTNGSTYTIPTSISEASTDTLSFTPVNDPQKSIAFNIDTVGTGDWTVTIHDQQNRTIASKTITNANVGSGWTEFIFSSPWRTVIGKTYHAHITVSTGTSKVVSSSLNDLSTGNFYTYFSFLVSDTSFHPILPFLNFTVIGNERYLAKWDGAFYNANYIAFPTGWKVRCFGYWREFLAIGMWKGGNIYDYDKGRIYFWDGISATFNFFIDVPEGQINALYGIDSDLYFFAGYRGNLLVYKGGGFYTSGDSMSNKLRFLPKRSTNDYFEIYPGAITMWRGLLHFGAVSVSNSTSIERGVYAYGTLHPKYPETLSFDYPISTGNRGSSVKIGLVYPVGTQLMIGWQDGSGYGVDTISFSNNPASQGTIEFLAQDFGSVWKENAVFAIRGDHLALASGESISIGYKVDRATSYTTSNVNSTSGSTKETLPIGDGRGKEVQMMANLFATGSTSPTLLSLSMLYDDLPEEKTFG